METQTVNQNQTQTQSQEIAHNAPEMDVLCDAQKVVFPESLQNEIVTLVELCNAHGLVLLDGPPGSGKTTVAKILSLFTTPAPSQTAQAQLNQTSSAAGFGGRRGSSSNVTAVSVHQSITHQINNNDLLREKMKKLVESEEFKIAIQDWNVSYVTIPEAASAKEWMEECERRRQESPSGKKHHQGAASRFASKIIRKLMPPVGDDRTLDTSLNLFVQSLREILMGPIGLQHNQKWQKGQSAGGQKPPQKQVIIIDNVDFLDNLCDLDEGFEKAVSIVWDEIMRELKNQHTTTTQQTQQQSTPKTQTQKANQNTCILLITANPQTRERFSKGHHDCAIMVWPDLPSADISEDAFKYTGGRMTLYQKWSEFPEGERKARMDELVRSQMKDVLDAIVDKSKPIEGQQNEELHRIDTDVALRILDALVRNAEGRSNKHITDIARKQENESQDKVHKKSAGVVESSLTLGEVTLLQLLRWNVVNFPANGDRFYFFLPATSHIKHLWKKEKKESETSRENAKLEKQKEDNNRAAQQVAHSIVQQLATIPAPAPAPSQQQSTAASTAAQVPQLQISSSDESVEPQPEDVNPEKRPKHKKEEKTHKHESRHKSRERRNSSAGISDESMSGRTTPEVVMSSQSFSHLGQCLDALLPMSMSHPGAWCSVKFLPDPRTKFPVLPSTRAATHGGIRETFYAAAEFSWGALPKDLHITFYLVSKAESGSVATQEQAETEENNEVEVLAPDAPVACCLFDGSTKGEVYYLIHDHERARHGKHGKKKGQQLQEGGEKEEESAHRHKHRHSAKREHRATKAEEAIENQKLGEGNAEKQDASKSVVVEKTHHRRSSSVPDDRASHRHHRHSTDSEDKRRKHRREQRNENASEQKQSEKKKENGGQQRKVTEGSEEGLRTVNKMNTTQTGNSSQAPITQFTPVQQDEQEVNRNERPEEVSYVFQQPTSSTTPERQQQAEQTNAQNQSNSQQNDDIRVSPATSPAQAQQHMEGQRGGDRYETREGEEGVSRSPLTPPQPQNGPPAPAKSSFLASQRPGEKIYYTSQEVNNTNANNTQQNYVNTERRDL